MACSEACAAAGAPVVSTYEPKGTFERAGSTEIYHSGSGALGLVMVPDVFGFAHKQVFQVADRFADAGFNVCVMDPFHGNPWPMDKFPPKPEHDFQGWLTREAGWGKMRPHVHDVVAKLKEGGASKFGCIGFCWGVSIAMQAGQETTFSGVGGAHPALFGHDLDYTEKVQCPVVLLPAQGDADTAPIKKILDRRPYGSKCVYQRFDDQTHGFVAARGDWTKPEVAAAAGKAIGIMADFLKHAMTDPPAEASKNCGGGAAAAVVEHGHGHHGTRNANHPGHGHHGIGHGVGHKRNI
ncbi:hypothetical protein CHLRE_16g679750v5 [Chlamydomonas reinhardtii]|uniref:Dienelactone hydrolase domain-containing protein n=1 Tax=Chlamydomonas reinhardtii TaxID=3055 RepID=A0A2K3CV56_CHLRE|nr:uncharacterized protein CHLRE_16g679750v5 [Chlamydomonas reinhardtii]PNW72164.1 hypothetical protein CHLRE_16g679750v5 [Chlamydomonas reinhardtii]